MFIWVVILAMSVVGGYRVETRRQRRTKAANQAGTSPKRPVCRARWAVASRARQTQHPSIVGAPVDGALAGESRSGGRPDVDAAVQLAAEIALSQPRKFRYNRGE